MIFEASEADLIMLSILELQSEFEPTIGTAKPVVKIKAVGYVLLKFCNIF